jgi:methane monooxygenase component A beta chain/propane monooxygenase small subunit
VKVSPHGPLEGHRAFLWIKAQKKRPTEYETTTVGLQSDPARWLHVGWPLLFDDGRPPFTPASTALRCERWEDFRDPSQLWQRPYVARTNREEQTLETLTGETLKNGFAQAMNPTWRDRVIGKYYAAWPFVEYGQYLALCYAVREALAETITFATVFEACDKARHGQDIVHLLFELAEAFPGFTDKEARAAWMSDSVLVTLRECVERLVACRDWGEILFALNLVLEPLAGELFKSEFLGRNASRNGDPVTPMILAGVRRDSRRHTETAQEFLRLVLADARYGGDNQRIVQGWLSGWRPLAERAAAAMRPLFETPGIIVEPFELCFARVVANQRALTQAAE